MKTQKTWKFCVALFSAIFVWGTAQTVHAVNMQELDLATCMTMALEKDQSLIAAEEAVKKAEAVLMKARSGYYPQVKVNASYIKLDDPYHLENFTMAGSIGGGPIMPFLVQRFDFSDEEMTVTEATVELPIFTWGRITNMNRLAKRGVDVAKHKRRSVRDGILFNVIRSFKQVLLAREARKILLETISEMELFYKTARKDLKKGARNAPEKDVLQIQYDLDDMRTWLPELEKWETLSIEALKIFMAVDSKTPINVVGDVLEYTEFHPELDDMVALAMANRPEIQMVEEAVKSAKLQKKMAAVGNLPMIAAFAKKTWTHDDFDPNQSSVSAVGVGAQMHFFDGFKSLAEYKEASYQAVAFENQLSYARKQIGLQVQQVATEVDEFYEQLKIREEAREKAIEKVKVVRKGYRYGITTADDVNDAQVQKRWSDAYWLFKKLEYVQAIAKLNQVVSQEVYSFR